MARARSLRWTVIAGMVILGVGALTLVPAPGSRAAIQATPWWCVSCGAAGTADLFQNLLLLLPLGLVLARLRLSTRVAALLLLLLPIAIEITQATLIEGRDATVGDVLANALGGWIGFWFGVRARLPVSGARHGWRWAALLVGLFVAQLIATASLVRPSFQGPEPWRLRLAPDVSGRPVYRGSVTDLRRNGRAILNASLPDAQGSADQPTEWQVQFTWQAVGPGRPMPIVRLDDAHGWPLMALDQRSSSVGLEVRTRGGLLRLRTPTWRVAVPGTAADGDTVEVRYRSEPGGVLLDATVNGDSRRAIFAVGAQHGWSLINPFTPVHDSPRTWHRWTLAWLLGWGVLLGLVSVGAPRGWVGLGAALVGLVATTMWSGTLAGIDEGAALVLGWLAGVLVSSATGSRRTPVGAAHTTSHRPAGRGHP